MWGNQGNRVEDVLFDSGASVTVIREDFAKDICTVARYPPGELENNLLILADGKTTLQAIGTCDIHPNVEGVPVEDVAKVVEVVNPDTQPALIIGQNMMQRFVMQIRHNEKERGGDRLIVPKPRKAIRRL